MRSKYIFTVHNLHFDMEEAVNEVSNKIGLTKERPNKECINVRQPNSQSNGLRPLKWCQFICCKISK